MSRPSFRGRIQRKHVITAILTCFALGAAPFVLTPYPLGLLTLALAYGLFAFGLDLAWGRTGIVSIGHAAFFGIGAYGVAVAAANEVPLIVGAATGFILSVIVAWVIGQIGLGPKTLPSTMAILTLAATLLMEQVVLSWRDVTRGSNGMFVPSSGLIPDYYRTAIVVVVVVAAVWFLVLRGPWGRRFRAVQSNEVRAAHLGISPRKTKVFALCLSGGVAAIAGATAAPVMGLVSPSSVGIILSTQVLVWLAVGGRGTIAGAFLGAALVSIGQQYLGAAMGSWYLLVLGVLFILVVRFAPTGLVGTFRMLIRRPIAESAAQGTLLTSAANNFVEPGTSKRREKGAEALALQGTTKSFGATRVITDVDLEISDGEIVCLIGPNGAGKTTLLNMIAGDVSTDGGSVLIFGHDVSDWSIDARAREGLGKVFQIPSVFVDLTPAQNIRMAQAEALRLVEVPAAYARFTDEDSVLAGDLPLADRRALELAMVLAWGPRVILLDEPAAGLSHEESINLARRLRAVALETGCTLVTVEHDMEIVRELAERVVVLANGRLLVDGSMDDVSNNDDVRRAYLGVS